MNTEESPIFWMGGRGATGLLELSHDPAVLDGPGFWAVQVDYEGAWTCARFATIAESEFESKKVIYEDGSWRSTLVRKEYISYVERIRSAISIGDVYQANACRILSRPHHGSLSPLFSQILKSNPAPMAAYLRLPGMEIASASPELFLRIKDGQVLTSPIKGTSKTPHFGEKDKSENIMILDLMRNDLSQICEAGSIDVPRLLGVEAHPGLFHLVSDVTGILRKGISWSEIASKLLPAGSITGAPKKAAVQLIASEEERRGAYCGLIGWACDGEAELAVAIRTFWKEDGMLKFGTGAGITWGSDAVSEWEETELKAARLIDIADGRIE